MMVQREKTTRVKPGRQNHTVAKKSTGMEDRRGETTGDATGLAYGSQGGGRDTGGRESRRNAGVRGEGRAEARASSPAQPGMDSMKSKRAAGGSEGTAKRGKENGGDEKRGVGEKNRKERLQPLREQWSCSLQRSRPSRGDPRQEENRAQGTCGGRKEEVKST